MTSPSQAVRSARPHPFAVPSELLAAVVSGTPGSTTLLLPSVRRAPLDSPEMVRVAPRSPGRSAPSLLAWEVPTLGLEPASLPETLARLTDPDLDAELNLDLRPAASLHYLATWPATPTSCSPGAASCPACIWTDHPRRPAGRWR